MAVWKDTTRAAPRPHQSLPGHHGAALAAHQHRPATPREDLAVGGGHDGVLATRRHRLYLPRGEEKGRREGRRSMTRDDGLKKEEEENTRMKKGEWMA